MKRQEIRDPEWIKNYCMETLPISECVVRERFYYENGYGDIYICNPFPGIHLWANDVYMEKIPTEQLEKYNFIKLNYCTEGRSEVLLKDERYVYLEPGVLSVDSNEPKGEFLFPGGRYAGLEMILDLEKWNGRPLQTLLDLGIDPMKLKEKIQPMQGSCVTLASKSWKMLAETVMECLKQGKGEMEDFRFAALHLLYLLGKEDMEPVRKSFCLTKGQRLIVAKVEEELCRDLKRRHTAEELASAYGISPSSLKKYFEKVYGMSISEYTRQKRMELACRLLAETRISISEVAAEAGYGNQGKFGSVFKRYTQKSPLEYRRLHSERSGEE